MLLVFVSALVQVCFSLDFWQRFSLSATTQPHLAKSKNNYELQSNMTNVIVDTNLHNGFKVFSDNLIVDLNNKSNPIIRSPLSPNLQLCNRNPLISEANIDEIIASEHYYIKWFNEDYLVRWDEYFANLESNKDPLEAMGPVEAETLAYNPTRPYHCPHNSIKRWGRPYPQDGGKLLCGLKHLKQPCLIYSLGSSNDFSFELDLASNSECEIHTFDCTSEGPHQPISRHSFHRICLGGDDGGDAEWMTYPNLLKSNNHNFVDVLKIDIEGLIY